MNEFGQDGVRGTSTVVLEKYHGDEHYNTVKRMVRAMAVRFGLKPETEMDRAMLEHGVWNAHDAVWNQLEGVLGVDEKDGLLHLTPRVAKGKILALSNGVREFITLMALSAAGGLVADPTSNIFLNLGTEHLWRRVTGVGTQDQLFDNTHSRIGIGADGATAAVRTQTDLISATKTYRGMEAGFPTVTAGDASGGAKSTYKSVFETTAANHDHKEWVVDNKNSGTPGVVVMNRKVQDFGTKASGSTWTYTMDLRID